MEQPQSNLQMLETGKSQIMVLASSKCQGNTCVTRMFKQKTRADWEKIFDGTDACVTPVLEQAELEKNGFDQRPIVTLRNSPGLALADGDADTRPPATGQGMGVEGEGWTPAGLRPSEGGEEVLGKWMGWIKGRHYRVHEGGCEAVEVPRSRPRL